LKTIGVLDKNGALIGRKQVKDAAAVGMPVDPGDLPIDSTYKWIAEGEHYVPIGHGFGKRKTKQPFENELVIADMIVAMGDSAPDTAKEWLAWYNTECRVRDEELARRPK
jgi:hypothetical protein